MHYLPCQSSQAKQEYKCASYMIVLCAQEYNPRVEPQHLDNLGKLSCPRAQILAMLERESNQVASIIGQLDDRGLSQLLQSLKSSSQSPLWPLRASITAANRSASQPASLMLPHLASTERIVAAVANLVDAVAEAGTPASSSGRTQECLRQIQQVDGGQGRCPLPSTMGHCNMDLCRISKETQRTAPNVACHCAGCSAATATPGYHGDGVQGNQFVPRNNLALYNDSRKSDHIHPKTYFTSLNQSSPLLSTTMDNIVHQSRQEWKRRKVERKVAASK